MRLHLELQTELNIKAGMSPDEALYAAQRQFGNIASIQERARDVQGWRWLDEMLQDIRHGVRLLRGRPGFTLAAVAVLSLGIGVNAAIFNLVHSLLFAPPTYVRPQEIVRVLSQKRDSPQQTRDFSYAAYQEIRAANDIFSGTLASALLVVGVGEISDTRRAAAAAVSSNYFSVLGVTPVQGRAFLPEEETPGRSSSVVIVSDAFWKKRHRDPAVLGSTLMINGRPFTVVGITPEGFTGTTAYFFTEIWLPLGVYDLVVNQAASDGPDSRSAQNSALLMILGRLNPGLTLGTAGPAVQALAANLKQRFPVELRDEVLTLATPSRFASNSNDTAVAWVGGLLLGMAAIVLLIACLNLANMLLARGTARRKEIALRLALGGSRARIVRQLLTEGFLLALLGGIGGLFLAIWSSDLLIASLARMIPLDLVWTASPQWPLLAVTFGFCVVSTLTFALWPALKLSRGGIMSHLKKHAGEDVVTRRWKFFPRHPLVSVQIALSLALLSTAALFIHSATRAGAADTGLKADQVFLVEIDGSLGGRDQHHTKETYRRLSERFAALPGVLSASVSTNVPISGLDLEKKVRGMGVRSGEQSAIGAKWNGVGADYFETAGLPLLRGRAFTIVEATQADAPPVVIINELLAKRFWPDGDALGQQLQIVDDDISPVTSTHNSSGGLGSGEPTVKPSDTFEVIGIVPVTRHTLFQPQPDPGLYLPFARGYQSHVFFHLKLASSPVGREAATADLLRHAISEVDATLPVLSVKSFTQHLDSNIQIWIVRIGAALFSAFGALALGLAVVGIYGVVAYSVARRTREIGIRMALGARPGAVQRMVLREGAVMLGTGLLLGLLLALGIGKIVGSFLYEVGTLDPAAFITAPGVLALVAFLACWIPARRATRVDPMIALRTE